MAGGDVVAGGGGRAENGETVGSSGAQASPVFQDLGIGKFWHERDCGLMQALHRCEVYPFVESGLFDGGADEEATVAARDEIGLGTADDMLEQRA